MASSIGGRVISQGHEGKGTNRSNARREFLLTLGAGGAGAIAASLIPATAGVAAAVGTASTEAGGYRDSAHIQNYYRTAAI